jgi:hypothetical protein
MDIMKKIIALPMAALLAAAMVACTDSNPAGLAPEGPSFELIDKEQRVDADDVNAHVYGSFTLSFTVDGPGGIGPITSGPANFPGNAKNAGTCDNGLWINPQNKRTSGNLERPHPHCVGETEGSVTVKVVLEPISAINDNIGAGNEFLQLADDRPKGDVRVRGAGEGQTSEGRGIIEAYAIDASTIGSNPRRVGVLTIDLGQYTTEKTNYFLDDCSLTVDETYFRCLNKVIVADYRPLAGDDGVGDPFVFADWDEDVQGAYPLTGFLYWAYSADGLAPFNYSDMNDGEE